MHQRRLAEREGFEPSVEFPLHTLSKRAPSTTRTSLRLESTICERPAGDYRTRRRSHYRGRDHLCIQHFETNALVTHEYRSRGENHAQWSCNGAWLSSKCPCGACIVLSYRRSTK